MYQWGDPYQGLPLETFEVGEIVGVKSDVALTGGNIGKLIAIDEETGTYLVKFENGLEMGFDQDMLIKRRQKNG